MGSRRVKHRYSGRCRAGAGAARSRARVVARSPEVERLRPGEFTVSTPLILGRRERLDCGEEDAPNAECAERRGHQAAGRRKIAQLSWEGQNRLQQQCTGSGDRYDDQGYRAIVQGVYISWITFLTTTACQPQMPRGARSLMSMALDKTSEYILHEQERLDNLGDKDTDADVADYIITELENTYAFHDRGWEPLKELVRAHGIRLMCEAVRKRHFSPKLSRSLILNAASASFYDAAEALLSALLSLSPSIPPPGRLDNSLLETESYFSALNIYVERTGRRGIWYQEMAALIARGAVPVEWIATDPMNPFMTSAIQSVSSDDSCSTHSERLLTVVLHAALGMNVGSDKMSFLDISRQALRKQTRLPQSRQNEAVSSTANDTPQSQSTGCDEFISTALTNTVSSILTILCGAHLTRLDDAATNMDSPDISSPMRKIISLVSTTVQQEIELKYLQGENGQFSGLQSLRIGYILMADYILNCQTTQSRSSPLGLGLPILVNFERFLNLLSNRGEFVGDLSILVLQVSRCWGRAQGTDGFEQAKYLTESLTSTDTNTITSYPILHAIFTKIAIEVALNFAELTCLRDHHAWALHVQEKVADLGPSSQGNGLEGDEGPAVPWTPSLALPPTGFRWEDGIGEWVANSPVLERGRRKRTMVLGSAEVVVGGGGRESSASASSRRMDGEGSWGEDDGLQGSEEFEEEDTAPSSVGDDKEAEEQGVEDEHDEVEEDEAQSSDGSNDCTNEDAVSDSETPPPARAKRKSLLSDTVYGASKRRKQLSINETSSPRRRLRRRRTAPNYTVYRDDDDSDNNSNALSSGSGPVTRRRALQERNSALNHLQRRRQNDVEVVIKMPPMKKSPRMKLRGVQVVVPHDGWCSGWKRASDAASVHHGSEQEKDGQDDEEDNDDEEEDIFTNAPILRDRIHASRRWSSFSYSNSPASSSSASSSHAVSRHGSRSSSRQLRPGTSQLGLMKSRSILTFANAKREPVPCSQESSDDELSFVV